MDDGDGKIMREFFEQYSHLVDERKDLNNDINDIIGKAAEKAGVKKPIVRKAFNSLIKLRDKEEDELQDVVTVFEEVRNG